jgi:hypothetical protein
VIFRRVKMVVERSAVGFWTYDVRFISRAWIVSICPLKALGTTFESRNPAYAGIHDDSDADTASPTLILHTDWPNAGTSHYLGIKWLEASVVIEQYEQV